MFKSRPYTIEEMFTNTESFKSYFELYLKVTFGKSLESSSDVEKYLALARMIQSITLDNFKKTADYNKKANNKRMYYFSLEFLMGRMMTNNLMALGCEGIARKSLEELGIDLNKLEDLEADAGLGNGGLGRLAACFLDSIASLNYPGNGNTIRYKNGLFKQLIVNNEQVEVPDQWLRLGYPWEVRKPDKAINVKFYGDVNITRNSEGKLIFDHVNAQNVLAVPYDLPIVGENTTTTNVLRMWSAEASDDLPKGVGYRDYLAFVEDICLNLYPEDYSEEGKITRIAQEYFFVSAGLNTIIKEHLRHNPSLDNFAEKNVIQLNDTHPALAIPELMRILMDEYNYDWDPAWEIIKNTFAYTNHTVLQEALEKWPVTYIKKLLPRIYLIIEEMDNQFRNRLKQNGKNQEFIDNVAIISDGNVRMAYLSICGSFSVNGVAKIHSNILINDTFKRFYEIYPQKFNNKTNGITHRRWLTYSNTELCNLLSKYIGNDFKKDITKIADIEKHIDNPELLDGFLEVKHQKKVQLADYLKLHYNVDIDPNSIFDVQAKRLHAYKRQLLNAMNIIDLYLRIKEDPNFTMPKTTFIFGAKAASNYYFAKTVIKLLNCMSKKIDEDPQVSKFIKVVFIPNYCVTIAEKLMPAADVSEQISTAGKEASGTGNMKFMMNGAVTLGTMDGANVEIHDLVGDDNIVIFGMSAEEVAAYTNYNPYDVYTNNERIRKVIDTFTNGTWSDNPQDFVDLANEFLHRKDEYYLLPDFESYYHAHKKVNQLYQDRRTWAKMCLVNIARSAFFSSDRTIEDYVKDIWHIEKIKW